MLIVDRCNLLRAVPVLLYTWCSDVVDVIIITRRHVGCIPNAEMLLADSVFRRFIFHTTLASTREVYDVTSPQ